MWKKVILSHSGGHICKYFEIKKAESGKRGHVRCLGSCSPFVYSLITFIPDSVDSIPSVHPPAPCSQIAHQMAPVTGHHFLLRNQTFQRTLSATGSSHLMIIIMVGLVHRYIHTDRTR